MHIADVTINAEWQDLATVISEAISDTFTFDTSKKYSIQVKSDVPVTVCNKATTPEGYEGLVLNYSDQLILTLPSGNLYVKAAAKEAILNINEIEEE